MNKNRDKGNIIFFVGVIIFVVSLVVGFATDLSAVLIDIFMGIGLVVEFIGLCICYKKDKKEVVDENEKVKSLKEVRNKEEKVEDVVEVVNVDEKTTPKKVKTDKKKTKSTYKVSNSTKKKTTVKKTGNSTTKKSNTKKSK